MTAESESGRDVQGEGYVEVQGFSYDDAMIQRVTEDLHRLSKIFERHELFDEAQQFRIAADALVKVKQMVDHHHRAIGVLPATPV